MLQYRDNSELKLDYLKDFCLKMNPSNYLTNLNQ